MATKQIFAWPVQMSEDSFLDLAVQSRSRDEKLVLWQEEQGRLVVLFDGKVGYSWSEYYTDQRTIIVPGAYMILDRTMPPSMTGANVAGVTLYGVNTTLSYFYQSCLQSSYLKEARKFNKAKVQETMRFLWETYIQMNLAWCQNNPDIGLIRQLYEAYGGIITNNVKDMAADHVPLILDPENLVSMQ